MCVFALATSVLILLLPGAVAVPEAGRSSLQLVSSQLSRYALSSCLLCQPAAGHLDDTGTATVSDVQG